MLKEMTNQFSWRKVGWADRFLHMTDFLHLSDVEKFSTWQICLHISHVEKFPHVTEFPQIYHVRNMSWGEFLHMTNFFSTDAVCGVCNKYQVWNCIWHSLSMSGMREIREGWWEPNLLKSWHCQDWFNPPSILPHLNPGTLVNLTTKIYHKGHIKMPFDTRFLEFWCFMHPCCKILSST